MAGCIVWSAADDFDGSTASGGATKGLEDYSSPAGPSLEVSAYRFAGPRMASLAMEQIGPVFPVDVVTLQPTGCLAPFLKGGRKDAYDDLEMLANDLEDIDTRLHENIFLIDAQGHHWDVKLNILMGRLEDTQFFARKS